jgi:hypothetical protein
MDLPMKNDFLQKVTVIAVAAFSTGVHSSVITTPVSTWTNTDHYRDGNMFDVVTLGNALKVTGLDLNLSAGTWNIEVWEKSGTWVGFETNSSAWTKVSDPIAVTSKGVDQPTFFDVNDFILDGFATTALYITDTSNNAVIGYNVFHYGVGTQVGNAYAANADLQILEGASKTYPFAPGTDVGTFTPRQWAGSIYYTAVPLPTTIGLLSSSLLGLGFWRRQIRVK